MRRSLLIVMIVATTAATAAARPMVPGHDRVGALPDGAFVVLTDLCDEAPSCSPNRLRVFDAAGQVIVNQTREGEPGQPLPPALQRRMHRLYDGALRALGATAVAPEAATTDTMGLTTFARTGWTHVVEHDDRTGVATAHVRRADGTDLASFEVAG